MRSKKLPKTFKLIIQDPHNPKGELRFDCIDVIIENEFEELPFPSWYYGSRPTGTGTITAKFIKKGK